MIHHAGLSKNALFSLVKSGEIILGGNKKLKIYGRLSCQSGKRMLMKNRVFFKNETEAIGQGYRPCGHCLREAYIEWKKTKK